MSIVNLDDVVSFVVFLGIFAKFFRVYETSYFSSCKVCACMLILQQLNIQTDKGVQTPAGLIAILLNKGVQVTST